MADNVPITAGSGTNIATDDVSGVHYQKMKLDVGGDGASVPVSGSVPISHVQSSAATDSWDSETSQDTAVTLDVTKYASVSFHITRDSGTVSGGQVSFEASTDGTNWLGLWAVAPSGVGTATLNAALSGIVQDGFIAYYADVAAFTHFRLRLNIAVSGTATFGIRIVGSTAPTTPPNHVLGPNGYVGIEGGLTDGSDITGSVSTIAPVLTGGIDSDDIVKIIRTDDLGRVSVVLDDPVRGYDGTNQIPLKTDVAGRLESPMASGTGTIDANGEDVVVTVPTGASSAYILVTGTFTGTISFQISPNGSNWQLATGVSPNDGGVISGTVSLAASVIIPCGGCHSVRARSTAWTTGSASVTIQMTGGSYDFGVVSKGVPGVAVPGAATLVGGTDGTNLRYVKTDSAGELQVDVLSMPTTQVSAPAGTPVFVRLSDGSAATDLTRPDNGTFTDGTTPVVPSGYIFDETAGTALTENDVAAARIDSKRAVVLTLEDATTRGRRATISTAGELSTLPNGNIAHDTGDSGNPLKIGAKAETDLAAATMVADADRTDLYADIDGVLLTKPMCPFNNILSERVTNTNGTSTAFSTFGATASARNMITSIIIHNDSATDGFVDLRDGTGGSVLITCPAPQKGGSVINLQVPLRQPTANTALAYDVSAAITTVYITVVGFKSKA